MDILYIVPYVPNLIRVRPYNLIRILTKRGHRVTVLTLSTNEEQDVRSLEAQCHEVHAYDLPTWRSLYNTLTTLPTNLPLQASYSWLLELAKFSTEIINNRNGRVSFDVIHIEHLRGARYGLYIKDYLNKHNLRVPIIWDSVDCITHLFGQASERSRKMSGRWVSRFELDRTRHYERFLIKQFDRVLVTSDVDRRAFFSLLTEGETPPYIKALPNGVDLSYFKPSQNRTMEEATLVVSGKMSYHANVTMVLHLINEIMPQVWEHKPETKVWIVGKDPVREILALTGHPTITVTGTVNDLRPYLQNATIAVAPIQYGAGIQNKVLEAMACETPVLATSKAVSALDVQPSRDLLVADNSVEFAECILSLLENRKKRHRLSVAGRRFVEQNHDWDHIAAQLEAIYQDAIHNIH